MIQNFDAGAVLQQVYFVENGRLFPLENDFNGHIEGDRLFWSPEYPCSKIL